MDLRTAVQKAASRVLEAAAGVYDPDSIDWAKAPGWAPHSDRTVKMGDHVLPVMMLTQSHVPSMGTTMTEAHIPMENGHVGRILTQHDDEHPESDHQAWVHFNGTNAHVHPTEGTSHGFFDSAATAAAHIKHISTWPTAKG